MTKEEVEQFLAEKLSDDIDIAMRHGQKQEHILAMEDGFLYVTYEKGVVIRKETSG